MKKNLFIQAIAKFTLGVVLIGALIFWPAGTFAYPNGWLFMGILFIPMFCAGLVMMAKNPYLLEKRLDAKETEAEQSLVVKLSGLMFLTGFVLAGLDFRFGWLPLPCSQSSSWSILEEPFTPSPPQISLRKGVWKQQTI